MKKIIEVIFFILVSYSAGIIGSFFSFSSKSDWYKNLNKPFFTPPSWIFGPVWTLLYILMGVSAYLIYSKRSENSLVNIALVIFFVHLIFNATWSIAFFGMQNPGLAFVNIIVLLIFIVTLFFFFSKIDKTAAFLILPYFVWVSFATILNYSIWQLN